jgi:2-oxoglutarate dehydrogenase E1 component
MKRDFIKPLIIATPKSLLRAKYASSPAEEFIHGRFEEILGEGGLARRGETINAFGERVPPVDKVKRIIFCSGKVYYDLLKYRSDRKIDDAVIIRIEQLYPLAETRLREMLKPFPKNVKFVWCQEEPQSMGAWTFIEPRLRTLFCAEIAYAGREASASPAVGALARHKREQARLVADAFSV